MIIGTIAIVAAMMALGVVVNRKYGIKPEELAGTPPKARIAAHEIGEAPATALRASDAQLAKLRPNLHCKTCRSILHADGSDEVVRYGGEPMRVLGFWCPRCNTKRPLYVRPSERNA
ncbi:hypothetical protein BH11MYX1_BH11MYX1_52200 [soil metagenome]